MREKKSFTIIEILITMLIIGTLSSTLIPRIGDARKRTDEAVELINANRNIACTEGLDDLCDNNGSSNGGGDTSNGVHYNGSDISICRDGDCITMQDKNLGASKAGTECNSTDTGACGYHFQWGNNHGFAPCREKRCTKFPNNEKTSTGTIDCSLYGPSNRLNTGTFIKGGTYCRIKNNNMWGGGNDDTNNNYGYPINNPEQRQGPCPDGYHVPSIGEWDKVLEYWAKENEIILQKSEEGLLYNNTTFNNNSLKFKEDFKIPFTSYRDNWATTYINGGKNTNFYSSSSVLNSENARYFLFMSGAVGGFNRIFMGTAYSIRCFKN